MSASTGNPVAPRRLVVASYYWPPSTSVGGARWLAMRRHLAARGHEVRVLTTTLHGREPGDAAEGVMRSGDLAASDLLRRALRRPEAPDAADLAATPANTAASPLLTRVLVPDAYALAWLPSAVARLARLRRSWPFDCLVTTGPPSSAHLLGLTLGPRRSRREGWIADFRDGWRFEPPDDLRWPAAAQDALDARLERRVAASADACIGVTRPIAEDLEERLGARAAWIPNGWDPALESLTEAPAPVPPREGWATLVHTGTLSGPWGRDPRPLLRAIGAVNAERRHTDLRRVRLVFAGHRTESDEQILSAAGLGEAATHVGLLGRADALALQRSADALVLITSGNRSEATGKLFEYLHAGRPILALAEGNEAARIIAETGTGVAIAPHDETALRDALRRVADGGFDSEHAPHDLDRFTYPGPALAMEDAIEAAVRA